VSHYRPLLLFSVLVPLCMGGVGLARWVAQPPPGPGEADRQEGAQARTLWAALRAAEGARDWPACQERARQLLQLPEPAGADLHDLHARAERALLRAQAEERNLLIYDRFLQAAAQQAPDAAVLSYGELSEDSVYRELGAVSYLEMRKAFVRNHLLRAQAALRAAPAGCRAAQPHLDAILAVDPAAAVDERVRAVLASVGPRCSGALAHPGAPGNEKPSEKPEKSAKGPAPPLPDDALAEKAQD